MTNVSDVLAAVDRLAPLALAESWDNVGLLLGDGDWPVRRVLVSLDLGEAVVDEAERIQADLVFTHHPLIFKDIDRLTDETRMGRLALRLLGAKRALIAAHTNLDGAAGGLCEILGEMVGLADMQPLRAEPLARHYKVVVFVPAGALQAVRAAAFQAGAGRIGAYTECSFSVAGAGTFRPGKQAKPAVGKKGRRNDVPEHRLEVLVSDDSIGGVLAAVGRAHPYEEPAIDVYPLHARPSGAGAGRVGRLASSLAAGALADITKRALGLSSIALALGDLPRLAYLIDGDLHPLGNLFQCGFATQFLNEAPARTDLLVDRLDHVHGHADRARLVGDGSGDGLPNPPRGVRREFVAATPFKLLDRLHEPDIALLNQVEEL